MVIRPQPGPQKQFLQCEADIAIYGGAAGGGKSWAILAEPLRHNCNPKFGAVIFRRTTVQIKKEGGLWDESEALYPALGATGRRQAMQWKFPSGATITMAHLEHDKNRFDWQGAQIPFMGFDEITHFSSKQFWYLSSRLRSTSGVSGYIRATCNPDPDSWVAEFISWWINQDTGYAIPERSGVVRYFWRVKDQLIWGDSAEELIEKFPDAQPKSVTFIASSVHDNKILLEKDPSYLATLMSLPHVEREQLLKGNWKVRPAAGMYFKAHLFGIVDEPPADVVARVRYWDRAATEKRPDNDPDATAGVKLSKDRQGIYYVEDCRKMFATPHVVEQAVVNTAGQDGKDVRIGYMQDPGSAGVSEAQAMARALDGYTVSFKTATGDKQTRAKPIASQAGAGNVKLVRGPWNAEFLRILENFPMGGHDDEVDALSGAHEMIAAGINIFVA